MSESLESRLEKLQQKRIELEKRIKSLPVSLKQLKHYLLLKKDYGCESVRVIKTYDDYYEQSYEQRVRILQVPNLDTMVLCKTILLKNTKFNEELSEDQFYPRFVGVIIQYRTKMHSGKLADVMKQYQNDNTSMTKASKKLFHWRLAEESENKEITHCEYNGVTPFEWDHEIYGRIPIVLSKNILKLDHQIFYLGAGEFNTKMCISVDDFKKYHGDNLLIGDIIYEE